MLCALFRWVKDPGFLITFIFWLGCVSSTPDRASSVVSKRPFVLGQRQYVIARRTGASQWHKTEFTPKLCHLCDTDQFACPLWAAVSLSVQRDWHCISPKVRKVRISSGFQRKAGRQTKYPRCSFMSTCYLVVRWCPVTSSGPGAAGFSLGRPRLARAGAPHFGGLIPEHPRDRGIICSRCVSAESGLAHPSPAPDIDVSPGAGERGKRVFC